MTTIATKLLNDGTKIPLIGLGVYQAAAEETLASVKTALSLGYRHVDTAQLYGNEAEVARAVKESGIPREEVWITTKVWRSSFGYQKTLDSLEKSLQKMKLGYVDLLLLHCPPSPDIRAETWKAMEKIKEEGKAKSIGVSNYGIHHLEEMKSYARVMPSVNQIELSPYLTRTALVDYCKQNDIVLEAYSPLTKGEKLADSKLVALSKKYSVTPAQLLIRWGIEHDFVTLPKSVTPERISQNANVFGFKISKEDLDAMDSWNQNLVTGWDPTTSP